MNFEEKLPKSIIVHIDRFSLSRDLQLEALQEFKELCLSSGTEVYAEVTGKIDRPSPNFFVKRGKVEEIKELVRAHKAALVIFNNELSPSQERNLEKFFQKLIFFQSPIGKGLIGKNKSDLVEINTPAGIKNFEIKDVKYI